MDDVYPTYEEAHKHANRLNAKEEGCITMENEKSTENQILSGKCQNYKSEWTDNFICPGELTVQITLSEYRDLVQESATTRQKISEANDKRMEYYHEVERLKKENAELKEKIVQLAGGKTTQDASEEDEDE
ncbi:hypothetical protein [uncultured Selenomonas sp.]|uniref:hypothetical protein n=1 Tax=uncultured Selenomonas sp. TaxID=159275 RepID=UPI0028D26D3A|nr:hypothetical protein [uncultured Selenomonas sp.]